MQAQKAEKAQGENAPTVQKPKEVIYHTLLEQIRDTLLALDKAITNKETRTISKLTRQTRKYRNVIKPHHLLAIAEATGIECNKDILQSSKDFDATFTEKLELPKNVPAKIQKTLELESFLKTLFILLWWRENQFELCLSWVNDTLGKIMAANRRSLDYCSSLLYFYFLRIHEKKETDISIRETLLEAYNKCCVRSDEVGQSMILNLLLRNYLRYHHIDAAYNLIQKTSFPESKSINQFCKYLYYTGKVKAIRREYAESLNRLNQAIRKSPDSAKGFKIQCQKAAIVVELLQGEIPNREIFSDQLIFANAYPYYRLIQAVLEGDLVAFNKLVSECRDVFQKDRFYTMILRLNQIVLRIGLRKIYLSYSKISLKDVSVKLAVPAEDVEFIVAKAIREGIINGEINHETQILTIKGDQNLYVTNDPQAALHKRISYCLGLYHETQKAITYPDMKIEIDDNKEMELDTSELMNLLSFDDDM